MEAHFSQNYLLISARIHLIRSNAIAQEIPQNSWQGGDENVII